MTLGLMSLHCNFPSAYRIIEALRLKRPLRLSNPSADHQCNHNAFLS